MRPPRAAVWPDDRVRLVGQSVGLYGRTGTVLGRGHDEGRMPTWVVALDATTDPVIPSGDYYPRGGTVVVHSDSLERLPDA